MENFTNNNNAGIVINIIHAIQTNKVYLSDIDGQIGDGDHGINMNKGFSAAEEKITTGQSFSTAMQTVGDILLLEIGGSMGPIYGSFFRTCARKIKDKELITAPIFIEMLDSALESVKTIGGAKVGDKTLIDTMEPATSTIRKEWENTKSFRKALEASIKAAETGKDSTRDMVAQIGRAARLGERSVGVLDAGATSCYIILKTMFESIIPVLKE